MLSDLLVDAHLPSRLVDAHLLAQHAVAHVVNGAIAPTRSAFQAFAIKNGDRAAALVNKLVLL